MMVNGVYKSLNELTYIEIGQLLLDASPNKDGIGLVVTLTREEERDFTEIRGLAIGTAISSLIGEAAQAAGKKLDFSFVYNWKERIFTTTAVKAIPAGQNA